MITINKAIVLGTRQCLDLLLTEHFGNWTRMFDIVLSVHHDKLHNRTNEMQFLSFICNNILYMFQIGKLFIIRRQSYMQRLVCIMLKILHIPNTAYKITS